MLRLLSVILFKAKKCMLLLQNNYKFTYIQNINGTNNNLCLFYFINVCQNILDWHSIQVGCCYTHRDNPI